MMIIMAHKLPDQVRGKLKLWFIEIRPNIFLSGLSDHLSEKITRDLLSYCSLNSGLVIIKSSNTPPGYEIFELGSSPNRKLVTISGLKLIAEKWQTPKS